MGWDLPRVALIALLALLLLAAGIQDARTREIGNGKNAAIALLAPLWWWACGLSPWPDMAAQLAIGLGLFIVREIVRAHLGEVTVRSSAEEGTTFTVSFPRPAT